MIRPFRVPVLTRAISALVAVLAGVVPVVPSAAQGNTACSRLGCQLSIEEALASVGQISQRKQSFVGAVRQLLVALAGRFGDEGAQVQAAVASMGSALTEWDQAILAFETRARQARRPPEVHLALGVVYLDRYRLDAALREFTEAGRLAPQRTDALTYQALVHALSSRPAAAAAALAKAFSIEPGRPALVYSLARQLALAGQDAEAVNALRTFAAAQYARTFDRTATPVGGSPFERVALLRQPPGVAPIFAPAHYADAFVLLTRGAYREAVDRFEQLAARDPLVATIGRDRLPQGSAALRAGSVRSAIEHWRAAVTADAGLSEAHRLLAVALREADQQEESIREFQTAISLNPDDERSRIALAELYGAAGQDADAERTLQEAIARLPRSGQAYYSLGRLQRLMAKNLDAARAFERAAAHDPLVGQDSLYEAVGAIHVGEGDFDRAADAFQARVDVSPNSADAHRRLGEVLLQRSRHDEALAEFMAALLIDPGTVRAYAGVGQLRLQQGRYAEAAEAAQRAVDLDPAHPGARYSLGAALLRSGRKAEGQKEIEIFERLQAENRARDERDWEVKLLRQAASASLDKGDIEQVAEALRKVIPYAPDDPASYISLGAVLKKLGQHAEAIEQFEKALSLKAGADVHRLLAESYQSLGRLEESRRHRAVYDRATEDRLKNLGALR